MAQRRMFSKRITNSGKFLKMPISSQALYFHLGMEADDDGIVEAYQVMRMTGFTEDDLRVLVAKEYVKILNEDMVSYIMDWREHNLIRADRKIDSIYKDLLLQIVQDVEILEAKPRSDTKQLTGRPVDTQRTAQVRLGKVSKGKDNIFSESFNKFWYLYDKKIGKMKSVKLWNKIHPGIHIVIYRHVETYVKSTPDKQYRKNPDVYLRNQCWNDEIIKNNNETKYPYEKFVNNR